MPPFLIAGSGRKQVNRQEVQNFINCVRVTGDETLLERFQMMRKKKPHLAVQNIKLLTSFRRVSPVLALSVLVVFVNWPANALKEVAEARISG
ncbi:MAG TPA: hypothetical protein VK514_11695 [Candidatus Acidoferrum sp.]|nr:hypothetical protein [Candidatus Acidoferrum sp.]